MKMKLFFSILIFVLFVVGFGVFVQQRALAVDCQGDAECVNLQQEIDKIQSDLQASVSATKPLEQQVAALDARIKSAQAGITQAKNQAVALAKSIAEREATLSDKYLIFTQRVRASYQRSRTFNPLAILLSSSSASEFTREMAYRRNIEDKDKQTIEEIGTDIITLEADKKKLEERQIQLAALQKQLDTQAEFFRKEIAGAKQFQANLQGKIAALSAKQQSILSEKTGTFQTSVGDVPLADDFNSSPAYNPGFSPAFAAFSFGAPHYKGMSQYGAYGRAKSGQSADDILKAYYGDVDIVEMDMPENITVDGVGSISFEGQYLKGIAEMPASWADNGGYEALKAQAIAARTYALASTGWRTSDKSIKKSICATEACQVYTNTKYNAGGRWHDAVNDTKGKIIRSKSTGDVFSTMYASTSGGHQTGYSSLGHSTPGFWDTQNGRAGWTNQAYEKISGSPWFYKAWYKTRSGDTCGRSHPWLTQEEMADILNAWIVLESTSDDRIAPLGGCWGGNPYSMSELKDKANQYGGAVTSVSSVSIDYSNDGYTAKVRFGTNKGEIAIDGPEFKNVFNLRSPSRINIKSGLFNIEKK